MSRFEIVVAVTVGVRYYSNMSCEAKSARTSRGLSDEVVLNSRGRHCRVAFGFPFSLSFVLEVSCAPFVIHSHQSIPVVLSGNLNRIRYQMFKVVSEGELPRVY